MTRKKRFSVRHGVQPEPAPVLEDAPHGLRYFLVKHQAGCILPQRAGLGIQDSAGQSKVLHGAGAIAAFIGQNSQHGVGGGVGPVQAQYVIQKRNSPGVSFLIFDLGRTLQSGQVIRRKSEGPAEGSQGLRSVALAGKCYPLQTVQLRIVRPVRRAGTSSCRAASYWRARRAATMAATSGLPA